MDGGNAVIIVRPGDPRWKEAFDKLPYERQDIGWHPVYADIMAKYFHKGEASCAIEEWPNNLMMYPFVKTEGTMQTTGGRTTAYRSIRSIYGVGGLNAVHLPSPSQLNEFHFRLADWCRERAQDISSNLTVCHPVINNVDWEKGESRISSIGETVIVDLTPPFDTIEHGFKYSTRKHIKKAYRSGVSVGPPFNPTLDIDSLDHFLTIYRATLDRNNADPRYYLEYAFFLECATRLQDHCRFFYALKHDDAYMKGVDICISVSCEMVLFCGRFIHSFLGGTTDESLRLCANHLLKREIIWWAKDRGYQKFILGGGKTPNDDIFTYKRGFAPNGCVKSYIAQTDFGTPVWKDMQLLDDWNAADPSTSTRLREVCMKCYKLVPLEQVCRTHGFCFSCCVGKHEMEGTI